jgi:hypothetical protein
MRIRARAGAALAALAAAAGMALAAPFPYRMQHRIVLTGTAPVRALAAGPEAQHVYAAVGDEVRSFDLTGQAASRVKLPGVVTGLAAGAGDTLYAVVGAPARLVILSVRPLHVVVSVSLHVGAPSAVLFDPVADELFAESQAGHSVTRLDPGTGRRLGVVRLQGELMQMASDGRGTIYLANAERNALDVVDANDMTFSGEIPLARCRAPSGLAMDTLGRRLFVGCGNGRELIVDSDLGYTFRRLPIQRSTSLQAVFAFHPLGKAGWKGGTFVAGGSEVDAIRMYAFVRYDGGGTLALTRPETALALDPAAGELWLAQAPRAAAADDASGPELLVLGPSCTEVSR